MNIYLYFSIYLAVLLLAVIFGAINYRKADHAGKIVLLLLSLTLISESIGFLLLYLHKTRFALYHVFIPVELMLCTMYFWKFIRPGYRLPLSLLVFWPLAGVINVLCFNPINKSDSFMMIVENVVVMSMTLYALYKILLDDNVVNAIRYPHFWICTFFLIYQCYAFFFWAFFDLLVQKSKYQPLLVTVQGFLNIAMYAAIGGSFFLFRKAKAE